MQYIKLDKTAPDLKYEKPGDAGLDLTTRHYMCLAAFGDPDKHHKKLAYTGIAVKIPFGLFGLVVPRSSMAKRGISLANTVGIIDSGYTGELMLYVQNNNNHPIEIEKGERLAQLIMIPFGYIANNQGDILPPKLVEKLEETERGSSGFGSTGI